MIRDILLLGGSGQVGREVQRLAWPPDIRLIAPIRTELDLFKIDEARSFIASRNWAAVINCAAYTAVDKAEQQIFEAWHLNAAIPALLAAATGPEKTPLIHVSTDYVFNGAKQTPYDVDDVPAPLSVYGGSKLGGELAIRLSHPRHAIVRTSWVFASHGTNFVRTMLRLGTERSHLRIVSDQRGRPTAAGDLARALQAIALKLLHERDAPTGTFHFANEGATSWYGLAEEIFRHVSANGGRPPSLEAIETKDYPTPAQRPLSSQLSTETFTKAFAIKPRPWREALAETMTILLAR